MARSRGLTKLLNTLQLQNDYTVPPAGLRWRSNTLFIISTVAVGLFTDLFLYGIVVPVLPFMLEERVKVPEDQVQSYVSALLAAYAASSVIASPIAGYFADKTTTRQSPFLFGLAALLASTILLFVGQTVAILALARVLQGISAAVVWTVGLALCLETVGPENLGKTIGSIFSFIAVGAFAAPLLGGVLYEKTGYIGVFAISAGLLVVDFVMRLLVIEKKIALKYESDDPDAVNERTVRQEAQESNDDSEHQQSNEDNEGSGTERTPLLGSVPPSDDYYVLPSAESMSGLFRKVPILNCLSDPMLLTALQISMIQALLLGSFDSTIPSFANSAFGFTSLKAGLLFIPLGVFDFIFGPGVGWCVDHYGTKVVAVCAYGFLVPVLICLRFVQPGEGDQIALYAVLLCGCGLGLAGIGAPSIVEAGAIVEKYYQANPKLFGENGPYAQLYGLSSMVFNLGLGIGPEIAGELKERIGYGNMNAVLAGICALTCALSFAFIGGRPEVLPKRKGSRRWSR